MLKYAPRGEQVYRPSLEGKGFEPRDDIDCIIVAGVQCDDVVIDTTIAAAEIDNEFLPGSTCFRIAAA